ncbi:MAG TPA: TIM-barrel domain-containing protein [Opitutaceae bacterium]|nr:TIM-barrel domain-containing protein [Opitutaceae bacterium]
MRRTLLLSAFALVLTAQLPAQPAAPATPREWSIEIGGGRLVLRPLLDNALRVRFVRGASVESDSLILTEDVPTPRFEVREKADAIDLELACLSASVDRTTGTITFRDASGRVFLREQPGTRRVEASTIHGEPTWTVAQSFDSPADERLFGTGQFQDGFLNIRDLPRRLAQVNTQIAIPFIVSSRGFGLLWHNYGLTEFNPADAQIALTARDASGVASAVDVTTTEGTKKETRQDRAFVGRFLVTTPGRYTFALDVGRKMARRWRVEIDGKPIVDFSNHWLPPFAGCFAQLDAGEHEAVVVGEKDDAPVLSFRPARAVTEFRSPVADALDYVVVAGHGDEITAAYRQLTGPAPLMPRWALGYIHCRERFKAQAELLANAAEFRARGLPIDVIVQDWQYWGRHGWNAMRFDEADYPDPGAMIAQLHAQHTRFMLSVWSKIDPQSEVGREFVARGYLIPGTDWVDFFNPSATAFYWENVRSRLLPLGIDAWWQDATEPENDDLADRRTHAGLGERMRNVYPLLVNRTVYEGLRRDDSARRPLILTRCAFAGQQRYAAATWSGDIGNDWETLRRQVTAGLGYVVTGLPWWTTDTGGFFRPGAGQFTDADYHERFLRWLQFSLFTPLLRVHGYQTDTEFWRYGPQVEAESRRWLKLRYRLLPYLYSETARVSFAGSTLMRPLVLDFPDDTTALDQTGEFMFGPALLVAPVLAPGVEQWPVYLPQDAGGWFDFWTGERHIGGRTVSAAAPLSRIPLFVRGGSILPLGPVQQFSDEKLDGPIDLRIYPGADADYTLYEDDGVSNAYTEGARATVSLHWDERKQTLTFGARAGSFPEMSVKRTFRIVWVRPGCGVGDETTAAPDASIDFAGQPLELPRPQGGNSSTRP